MPEENWRDRATILIVGFQKKNFPVTLSLGSPETWRHFAQKYPRVIVMWLGEETDEQVKR